MRKTKIDEEVRILKELSENGEHENVTRHNTPKPKIRKKILSEIYEEPEMDRHIRHETVQNTERIRTTLYKSDYEKILENLKGWNKNE